MRGWSDERRNMEAGIPRGARCRGVIVAQTHVPGVLAGICQHPVFTGTWISDLGEVSVSRDSRIPDTGCGLSLVSGITTAGIRALLDRFVRRERHPEREILL